MEHQIFARKQDVDPVLCEKYAQFASHMVRWQFKIIYWVLFATNLFVLFLASWTYTRGQDALERYQVGSRTRIKRLRQSILLCGGCVVVSTVIVIMEAYALMALQFCDGEDLMSIYWSTWTMIQVGSLIAIVGIILALSHSLNNRRHPPWALALGTPVLVIAGFLHLVQHWFQAKLYNRRQKKVMSQTNDDLTIGPPMSQANTIQVDGTADGDPRAVFIGLEAKGGSIIRFVDPVPDTIPSYTELIGHCLENKPMVIVPKEYAHLLQQLPDAEREK